MSKIKSVAWMRDAPMWIGENRYEPRKVVSIHHVEGAEPLVTESAMQQEVAEATAAKDAEIAELRKDAERYRFARSRAYIAVNPYYQSCPWTLRGVLEVNYNAAETHGFDAAIDAALAKIGEPE